MKACGAKLANWWNLSVTASRISSRLDCQNPMKTLFLSPPSFDGFDGGAGSRYQARREVTSFWYPTWLAQPAALVPDGRLMDCPPHHIGIQECLREAGKFDHVIIHTSTPSLKNDCKVAEAIKQQKPSTVIGFVGAHAAVLPTETLKASSAIDWAGRKEFDFTCKERSEEHTSELQSPCNLVC